ncbi:unnamed protein product [Brachionus calyciflorus]|uniref:C2H2-type domain-containing protein n=1 Tax=Brachionus calyciflorus TaxID=104777 RepID=A0A813UDU0_9BILA|nr:unnamed protein product [Brachionus calyciflorus]
MSKKDKIFNWLLKDNDLNGQKIEHKTKIKDDELIQSPVTGSYILKSWKKNNHVKPQIDWNKLAVNFVQITPQSKAKLAKIPNNIGPYECKLCKFVYNDAFELAMHNCPRVVHINYKCSVCGKSFNCPANLASHKRWHSKKSDQIKLNRKTSENLKNDNIQEKVIDQIDQVSSDVNLNNSLYYNQLLINNFYSSYYSFASQNFFPTFPFALPIQSNCPNIINLSNYKN